MPELEQLQLIDLEGLRQRKALFSRDWPKYYLEYQIISNIISFKTAEPLMKNVCAYTLPDRCAQDLVISKDRYQLFVGCLGESMEYLEKALHLLDWSNGIFCSTVPLRYIATVQKVIHDRQLPLEKIYDCALYHLPAKQASVFSVDCPEGFHFRCLSEHDARFINQAWPYSHEGSLFFVQRQIRLCANVGLYDEDTQQLVAWCIKTQDGLLGALHVDDAYKRRGFGSLLVKALSRRIADLGDDIAAEIVVGNKASVAVFTKLGFQMIDKVYWFIVKPACGEFNWPDGE